MAGKNFRKLETKSGKLMLAGKNAEQNEEMIKQAGKNELVLHTATPGSPFVNIKLKEKYGKEDVREAAVFCAAYSQAWKKSKIKKDILAKSSTINIVGDYGRLDDAGTMLQK